MRMVMGSLLVALVCSNAAAAIGQQPSLVDKPAPRFVRSDLNGKRIDLDDFRGRVVLLNFWATWCGPCRVELPAFSSWQNRYGKEGFQVVAVSMDDDVAPVGKTARRLHLNFPIVMGDEQLGIDYGRVLGLPVTYLIGRNGKIAARFAGETDLKQMESKVRELLLEQ
jgi:peroxiredoxin